MLPVVLYHGRRSWTAPADMRELVAGGDEMLAPYQPSQRYHLLDAARLADADLPLGNLVSALAKLERGRDAARLRPALRALIDLLRGQGDGELTQVFAAWVTQVLRLQDRLSAEDLEPLAQLAETYTMLEETVQEWREQGRAQGLEQGRNEERALLCRQAARKFDADTAERLAAALAGVGDPARLAEVGDWIIECATAADLFARVLGDS